MPYDEHLANRIQKLTAGWENSTAKKMFGGICHLLNGTMFCGVYKEYLILRLGEEQAQAAQDSQSVRPFDITGRPMKGWVMVAPEGCETDAALNKWLAKARNFTNIASSSCKK